MSHYEEQREQRADNMARESHSEWRRDFASEALGISPLARRPPVTPADLPVHPADPKQGAGAAKVPMAALPMAVVAELAVAHGEGAAKYGRHNWRAGDVLASTYFAAAQRHLVAWYEGEDIDPDSGLSHLVKAMASIAVLRDAQIQGCAIDDRPPSSPPGFMAGLCETHAAIQRKLSGS